MKIPEKLADEIIEEFINCVDYNDDAFIKYIKSITEQEEKLEINCQNKTVDCEKYSDYYTCKEECEQYKPKSIEPYKCPVCNGNGLVQAGFYNQAGNQETYTTTSCSPEQCRSCKGTGIINHINKEEK